MLKGIIVWNNGNGCRASRIEFQTSVTGTRSDLTTFWKEQCIMKLNPIPFQVTTATRDILKKTPSCTSLTVMKCQECLTNQWFGKSFQTILISNIHDNHTHGTMVTSARGLGRSNLLSPWQLIVRELACEQSRVLVLIFEKFLLFILNTLQREKELGILGLLQI